MTERKRQASDVCFDSLKWHLPALLTVIFLPS